MANKLRGAGAGPARSYSAAEWAKGYAAWLLLLPLYLFLWAYASVFNRIPAWLHRKLLQSHDRQIYSRAPDVRIPNDTTVRPYMLRWWRIKRNAFFNIYYHIVMRSDDDRALHDHPWWSFSIVLSGGYFEHTILPGGINKRVWHGPRSIRFRRSGALAHRLELKRTEHWKTYDQNDDLPTMTIFITGPVLRRWGFHHTKQWVDAYDFDEFLAAEGLDNAIPMAGYETQLKGPNQ